MSFVHPILVINYYLLKYLRGTGEEETAGGVGSGERSAAQRTLRIEEPPMWSYIEYPHSVSSQQRPHLQQSPLGHVDRQVKTPSVPALNTASCLLLLARRRMQPCALGLSIAYNIQSQRS